MGGHSTTVYWILESPALPTMCKRALGSPGLAHPRPGPARPEKWRLPGPAGLGPISTWLAGRGFPESKRNPSPKARNKTETYPNPKSEDEHRLPTESEAFQSFISDPVVHSFE